MLLRRSLALTGNAAVRSAPRLSRRLTTPRSGLLADVAGGGSSPVATTTVGNYQPLIPADQPIAPPPAKGRIVPNTFEMKVVFLGYGVGVFELEMLPGCPQLSSDQQGQLISFTPAQARFDLSAHPVNKQADPQQLKSSWASSKEVQESLTHRGEEDPQFSNDLQFGSAERQTAHRPSSSTAEPPTQPAQAKKPLSASDVNDILSQFGGSRVAPAKPSNAPKEIATGMPSNNRVVVHSSVIVYQNCMFCWSPRAFEEVTVESFAFLQTLTPRPELILLGTGSDISRRLPEDVRQHLADMRISIECMDSGNAIGTYNILTDEGRTVLAAMIMRPEPTPVVKKETRSQQMRRKLGYWTQQ